MRILDRDTVGSLLGFSFEIASILANSCFKVVFERAERNHPRVAAQLLEASSNHSRVAILILLPLWQVVGLAGFLLASCG